MKRKDINDYISMKLECYGGHGFSYDCYINSSFVGGSAQLRKLAKEDDDVTIEIYSGRGWNIYHVRTVNFTIEDNKRKIEDYRKQNEKSFNPLRDYQRSKVYKAERMMIRMFGESERLTPEQCQELANEVWSDYGFESEPPTIIVTSAKKSFSSSYSWNKTIKLAAGWGQAKKVVLHEIAHQIVDNGFHYPDPAHGKYFTAIILDLYEMYLGWHRESMMSCFKTHNCKVEDL